MNPMSTQYLPQGERDILRATNRQSLFALSEIRPDEFARGSRPRPRILSQINSPVASSSNRAQAQTRKAA